jgi:hypothetical protein
MSESTEGSWQQLPQVRLESDAAWYRADLETVRIDLRFAAAAMERARIEADPLVQASLWRAALMAYRRSFTPGQSLRGRGFGRKPVGDLMAELVGQLTEQERMIHKEALDLADRHVAHRVRDVQQGIVVAFLEPRPARGVAGIGPLWMIMTVDEVALAGLDAVARRLDALVEPAIADVMSVLWDEARANLDELYRSIGLDSAKHDMPG